MASTQPQQPFMSAPRRIDHIVLKVLEIERSHQFWCNLVGFKHVGTHSRPRDNGLPAMRFYAGEQNGQPSHHDIALLQVDASELGGGPQRLDHVAVEYPSEQQWRERIAFLVSQGIALHGMVERGATVSIHIEDPDGTEIELLYQRPRDAWESDIGKALNTGKRLEFVAADFGV